MVGTKGGRGRPRKSVEQLKLEGKFRADRHGGNGVEPKGKPIKPDNLEGEASRFWDAVTPELVELGIATEVDSAALASLCEWWGEYRDACDEKIEHERGLQALAEAVNKLSGALLVLDAEAAGELAERVLEEIGHELVNTASRKRSRLARMKTAHAEFTKLAARFGMTPMDRRAMRDVNNGNVPDDPITQFLKKRAAAG